MFYSTCDAKSHNNSSDVASESHLVAAVPIATTDEGIYAHAIPPLHGDSNTHKKIVTTIVISRDVTLGSFYYTVEVVSSGI